MQQTSLIIPISFATKSWLGYLGRWICFSTPHYSTYRNTYFKSPIKYFINKKLSKKRINKKRNLVYI
jgi:hypothetical protein